MPGRFLLMGDIKGMILYFKTIKNWIERYRFGYNQALQIGSIVCQFGSELTNKNILQQIPAR